MPVESPGPTCRIFKRPICASYIKKSYVETCASEGVLNISKIILFYKKKMFYLKGS